MHCISISHKKAPLKIRELFSFSKEEQKEFEKQALSSKDILGCVIVSTCNRNEIYFSGNKSTILVIEKLLAKFKNIKLNEIRKYCYIYSNEGAIRHLFYVAGGLDSMVIGEDEILRQVKEAYQFSLNNKSTNNELNLAFQGALNSAKSIKTDTKLSNTPVSIGTLTANKIVEFLEEHNGSTVLIIGITGQMGSIVAKNLYSKNCTILGTIRSHDKVKDLFINKGNIRLIEYKDRYQYLANADVIVSATTSPHYTLNVNEVSEVLKKSTCQKLFIDLAVPCDIDKEIMEIPGIKLVDIDYFEKASLENNQLKLMELDKAQLILGNCIDETLKNIYFQEFYPSIEKISTMINEKSFPTILYQLKDSLNKEQLSILLDSLKELVREEI